MQASDRAEFETILEELFAAFDKPLTDAKREAFWKGLQRMTLVEFARCRDLLLEELSDGEPRRTFAVSDVWAARHRLRARSAQPIAERSSLEAEIARLTQGDQPKRAAEFAAAVRRNVESWEEARARDPIGTQWLLLYAYIARVDVEEPSSSPIRAERLAWARTVCQRLLTECGMDYVAQDPRRMRVVSLLLGASAYQQAVAAWHELFARKGSEIKTQEAA